MTSSPALPHQECSRLLTQNNRLIGQNNTKQRIQYHAQVKMENNQLKEVPSLTHARSWVTPLGSQYACHTVDPVLPLPWDSLNRYLLSLTTPSLPSLPTPSISSLLPLPPSLPLPSPPLPSPPHSLHLLSLTPPSFPPSFPCLRRMPGCRLG